MDKEGGRSQVPCGAQMFLLDVLEEGMRQPFHRGWQQGDIHCSDNVENPSLVIEKMTGWVFVTVKGIVAFLVQKMPTEACWYFLHLAWIRAPIAILVKQIAKPAQ